jgi:purine-nucleoside phosphorylase
MHEHVKDLESALQQWHTRKWPRPSALLVSGSGLAVDLPGEVEVVTSLGEILPFPARAVIGHPHRVELIRTPHGVLLYQRGRLHSYQGYDANQTVFMVRLAALLGAGVLVMTNAAGGVLPEQSPGDLVVITDQINLTGLNPLRGVLPPEWGPQFPDMVHGHDPRLRHLAMDAARRLGIELSTGIYAGFAGPSFETPAEVEMARRLGADLVGMSTVLEVIAARHLDMRCLCFSLVSNLAAGVGGQKVDHEEVLETGRAAAPKVASLLAALIEQPELYAPPARSSD